MIYKGDADYIVEEIYGEFDSEHKFKIKVRDVRDFVKTVNDGDFDFDNCCISYVYGE